MKKQQIAAGWLLGLCALALCACLVAPDKESIATPQPSPTPKPIPLIAYLSEGSLWVVQADGANARPLVAAPESVAINALAWSADGSQIYFSVGLKFFSVALSERKVERAGELSAPPGTTIDRLELARDGATLIAHALEMTAAFNATPKPFAVTIGRREARELTVDEYQALARAQSVIVRGFEDLAVSPDATHLLFKQVSGQATQLFVADLETGARRQVTELNALDGFEESASAGGERQILEAAWSPDSRHLIFTPAQSCSETGLCYGRLYLVSAWGGPAYQLSRDMTVSLPAEWNREGTLLVYDDGGQVLLANTRGQIKRLAEGNQPRWQPVG
jgi:hypothetical protein